MILSHFRAVQSRSKAGVPVSSSPGRCRGGPAGLESGGPALRLRQRLRLRVGQEERRAAGPGAGEPLGKIDENWKPGGFETSWSFFLAKQEDPEKEGIFGGFGRILFFFIQRN